MSRKSIIESATKTGIGIRDKNGKIIRLGDRVRLDCMYNEQSHIHNYIKGTVVYGFYSAGYDEWGSHHKTLGFFVQFQDKSGTTGIDRTWEVIDQNEFYSKE